MSILNVPFYLDRENAARLAYRKTGGASGLPAVIFCGGFRSDMEGTKAIAFEAQCAARSQTYIRFDYSGHGASGGKFEDCVISTWRDDALAIIDNLTDGPVILAGSSLGGWVSLLCARERPQVAGIVGIAAAPDFTRIIRQKLTVQQKAQLDAQGFIKAPSEYSPEPYVYTRALIDDGEKNCLLDHDIDLSIPVRLIQGMQDPDVAWQTAFRIKNALPKADAEVLLVETGDHRLSRPEDIALIGAQIAALSGIK